MAKCKIWTLDDTAEAALNICAVNGLGFFGELRYKDKIDRVLDSLETGSNYDTDHLFSTNGINWPLVLEQAILQKRDGPLITILNQKNVINWAGSNSGTFLMTPAKFASSLKQLGIDEPSIFDYINQGKIITEFVLNHDSQIANLAKTTASDIMDYVLYWMVSINSVDDVQSILSNRALLSAVSEATFEYQIQNCVTDDNLEMFKVFCENPNSLERIRIKSKSIWSSIFPRILDYNMRLVQKGRSSHLTTYILSSSEIMGMMDDKIVRSLFYSSFANYEMLDTIASNPVALRKINTARFNKVIKNGIERGQISEVVARLWLNRPELDLFLTPEVLGLIYLQSADKHWRSVYDIILERDDLLEKIDADLLNKGITTNIDENLDAIGVKLIANSPLLAKLTRLSVGKLFSRFLALQHENIVNVFIQRDSLMDLVPPAYLGTGLDSLIVEDVGSRTDRMLQLFLIDKYIARITDEDWWTIVKHSIRYNKKNSWNLLSQHDTILRRLPSNFLKKLRKYVDQEKRTAINAIVSERPPETAGSGIRKAWNRLKDRRVKPEFSFSFPLITQEDLQAEFDEIKKLVKDMTKDGHILTASEQDAIMHTVLEHHLPKLPMP